MKYRQLRAFGSRSGKLALLAWFLCVAVSTTARAADPSPKATVIHALEKAVMPLPDRQSEEQAGHVLQISFAPFPEAELLAEKVYLTLRRGLAVNVTASNPFYVNLSINAP